MTKPFFEVFPTLDIKGALHDKLEQAGVERVSASKQRDRLNIYLYSTRLILKEDIWAAEAEIKNQLFADAAIVVHILRGMSCPRSIRRRILWAYTGRAFWRS